MRTSALPALVFSLAALLALPARAAEPASEPSAGVDDARTVEAREAFKFGAELAREARWEEARVMFVRSNTIKSHPVTLYNIAFCERAMGRSARALELFQRALDAHAHGPDHLSGELESVTRRYLAEASARVVRVRLAGVQAAELRVDGRALEPLVSEGATAYVLAEALEQPAIAIDEEATLLLDPGTHVFVARRAGFADVIETRAVTAGEQLRVDFAFRPAPPPVIPAVVPKPVRRPAPLLAPAEKPWVSRGYAPAALGVGALGLVVGAVAGGVALATRSQLRADCGPAGDNCPKRDANDIRRLHTAATLSTVAFIVGGVGMAGGLTLWVLAPAKAPERKLRLGLGLGGLSLRGELR